MCACFFLCHKTCADEVNKNNNTHTHTHKQATNKLNTHTEYIKTKIKTHRQMLCSLTFRTRKSNCNSHHISKLSYTPITLKIGHGHQNQQDCVKLEDGCYNEISLLDSI